MKGRTPASRSVNGRRSPGTLILAGLLAVASASAACATEKLVAGTVAAGVSGGMTPGQEIRQVYYFGVFDPRGQIPPAFYRVRVVGQASVYSKMKFGSGWVDATLVDSLGESVGAEYRAESDAAPANANPAKASILTGRGLILFGPTGFRPEPRNHRLVIVMGASPEAFFQAVDSTLGTVAAARQARRDASSRESLLEALLTVQAHEDRLEGVAEKGKEALGDSGGAK